MSDSDSLSRVPASVHIIPVRLTTVTLIFAFGVSVNVNVEPTTLNSAGNVTSPSGESCATNAVKL